MKQQVNKQRKKELLNYIKYYKQNKQSSPIVYKMVREGFFEDDM